MDTRLFIFPGLTTGQAIVILTLVLLAAIGIVVSIISYFSSEKVQTNQQILDTLVNRFGISVRQREIIIRLLNRFPNMDIGRFIHEQQFFEYMAKHYLKTLKRDGETEGEIHAIEGELEEVKTKLNFSTRKIFSSKDIAEGDMVRIKIEHIGLFTLKVMSNESDGLLLRFPYIEKLKEEEKIGKIVLYYWSDQRDYRVHTRIKRVLKEEENYILVAHGKVELQGIDPSGANIKPRTVPIYFEHIFDLTPEEKREIKSHIFRGQIVTFTKIGLEIVTREKILYNDTGFTFEFREGHDRYRFTGDISNTHKSGDGTHLFVTYRSISERTKKYINKIAQKDIEKHQSD